MTYASTLPPPAVSTRGLTKLYGERRVVDGIDLEIPAGSVAGFVGPNGAGKTTTMAMLLGLVEPTGGTGAVLGHPLDAPGAYLRRVGALIETPAFYPGLTGTENLRVLAAVSEHDPGAIPGLLERVGLADRGGDLFRRYSLGMKQRLGIAAALLGDPDLVVLDEPINGLDPAGIREMRDLIRRLADGRRTLLISSHVLAELDQVCDWLVVIEGGVLAYQGPAAAFGDRTASRLVAVPRDEDDLDDLRLLVRDAAAERGIALADLRVAGASLEERYLATTNGAPR